MAEATLREKVSVIRVPGYAFIAFTLLFQFIDFVLQSAPWYIGSSPWRFGTVGNTPGLVGNVLLVFLLCQALALAVGDRRVAFAISVASAAIGACLLLGAAVLSYDAMRIRASLPAAREAAFITLWLQALGKMLAYVVVAATVAYGGITTWQKRKDQTRVHLRRDKDGLNAPRPDVPTLVRAHGSAPRDAANADDAAEGEP